MGPGRLNVTSPGADETHVAESSMGELNPFRDVIVIVSVSAKPWSSWIAVGVTKIEKSGIGRGLTTMVRVVVCEKEPLVPVRVMT
jgi:hypothetical protein